MAPVQRWRVQIERFHMINPTESQLATYFATDQTRPVIFINCHRYHTQAQYPRDFDESSWSTRVTGHEAYHRYLRQVESDFMPQVGGRFLIAGPVAQVLIGEGNWDEIIIGEYPSRAKAMQLPQLPGYDDIAVHRTAGLAAALTLPLSQDSLYRLAIPDAWRERSQTSQ